MTAYKVLVYGHEWSCFLQDAFDPAWIPTLEAHIEFVGYPGADLNKLYETLDRHLSGTFTHIIVFTLISEAYKTDIILDSQPKAIVTDKEFTLWNFCERFQRFQGKCRELCPGVRIILVLPPLLDLIHYRRLARNFHDVESQSFTISEADLYAGARDMNNLLLELRNHEAFPWLYQNGGGILDINEIACKKKKKKRKHYHQFLMGEKKTLGKEGPLVDGIRPSYRLMLLLFKEIQKRILIENWIDSSP